MSGAGTPAAERWLAGLRVGTLLRHRVTGQGYIVTSPAEHGKGPIAARVVELTDPSLWDVVKSCVVRNVVASATDREDEARRTRLDAEAERRIRAAIARADNLRSARKLIARRAAG